MRAKALKEILGNVPDNAKLSVDVDGEIRTISGVHPFSDNTIFKLYPKKGES